MKHLKYFEYLNNDIKKIKARILKLDNSPEEFNIFENYSNEKFIVLCNWCSKWFFEEEEETTFNEEGDELCPFCDYPGALMNLYFDDIGGKGFYDYMKNNPPKINLRPEWREKEPVEFFKAAYPEWFEIKKYNL